jgi:hypothetical protein
MVFLGIRAWRENQGKDKASIGIVCTSMDPYHVRPNGYA